MQAVLARIPSNAGAYACVHMYSILLSLLIVWVQAVLAHIPSSAGTYTCVHVYVPVVSTPQHACTPMGVHA